MRAHKQTTLKQQASEYMQQGLLQQAHQLLTNLCRSSDADADCWFMLGAVCGQLGNIPDAETCSRKAVELAPNAFAAWDNLGITLMLQNKHQEAEKCLKKSIRLNPSHAPGYNNLGNLFRQTGRLDEAVQNFNKSLQHNPRYAEAHNNLSTALIEKGLYTEAEQHSKAALRLNPAYAEAHSNLGIALQHQGQLQEALDSYRESLKLAPLLAETHLNLGRLLEELKRDDEALACYRKALELKPMLADIHIATGRLYASRRQLTDAREAFEQALDIAPGNRLAIAELAGLCIISGEYEQAYERIEPHLDDSKVNLDIAAVFADVAPKLGLEARALEYLKKCKKVFSSGQLTDNFHFSMARLQDRLEQFDDAFTHYQRANRFTPFSSDLEKHIQEMDRIESWFTEDQLSELPASSIATEMPVFIVGMPRSGTTLVEQILASHPRVYGGGELTELWTLVNSLPKTTGSDTGYPDCLELLDQESCNERAAWYLQQLQEKSSDSARVTDKLPHNFLHLGLIQLLFPGAAVIHCTRDPVDTCLSVFFHKFNINHLYARDLSELGAYYRRYRALMKHWHRVLSIPVLDVCYEDLVADPEQVSRSIVKHCGLEWDERCLKFHENERIAFTPSHDQVRQPVYKDSIGRWKNYQRHISPLLEALEGIV